MAASRARPFRVHQVRAVRKVGVTHAHYGRKSCACARSVVLRSLPLQLRRVHVAAAEGHAAEVDVDAPRQVRADERIRNADQRNGGDGTRKRGSRRSDTRRPRHHHRADSVQLGRLLLPVQPQDTEGPEHRHQQEDDKANVAERRIAAPRFRSPRDCTSCTSGVGSEPPCQVLKMCSTVCATVLGWHLGSFERDWTRNPSEPCRS
jgi:hypothetical protein